MAIAERSPAHRPQDAEAQQPQQPLAVATEEPKQPPPQHRMEDISASINQLSLDSIVPLAPLEIDSPPTPPDAAMSSSGSVSSTEINDHLTPLPRNMTNSDRPSLLRRNSSSPRMSTQPNFSSPTLPSLSELLNGSSSSNSQLALGEMPVVADTASSVPRTPSDPGLPIKAASDSGTYALRRRASKDRSPRIRNKGGVLAPHGSFTSSRNRSSTIHSNSSRSSITAVSPSTDPTDSPQEMSTQEREKLFKAAASGDQLAMHRLGWRPVRPNHRHTLGSAEDIWGAMYSPTSTTRRSSGSSQASLSQIALDETASPAPSSTPTPPTNQKSYTQSDLFSDTVNMTLRSNALMKNRNPNPQVTNSTARIPSRKPSRKEAG